jgi:hypothetical protein
VNRGAVLLAGVALALGMACTVDSVVGSNVVADGGSGDGGPDGGSGDGGSDGGANDAGTPICPGTADICSPVCGSQTCHSGCSGLTDCVTSCSGTSCSFTCENHQACSPSCEPGPCTMTCVPGVGETVECSMSCNPAQTCLADCHGGTCTVACGEIEPAVRCDAGVYSCSGVCGP